jgi:alkanesulfonate monooxygenase SsuD/methylene tetrahydromethanopterin reductase-like flavin-dependent oxidoreductase (luciferase family)
MSRIDIAMSGGPNPAEIIDLVVLAERLGSASTGVAEGMAATRAPCLAACARRTSRILGAGPRS